MWRGLQKPAYMPIGGSDDAAVALVCPPREGVCARHCRSADDADGMVGVVGSPLGTHRLSVYCAAAGNVVGCVTHRRLSATADAARPKPWCGARGASPGRPRTPGWLAGER